MGVNDAGGEDFAWGGNCRRIEARCAGSSLRQGKSGYIVLTSIGDEAVLTVMARPNARQGLVILEMRRATKSLERIV